MKPVTIRGHASASRQRALVPLLPVLVVTLLVVAASGLGRFALAQEATPEVLPPLVAELRDSWNAHDPERYAALFTEDATVELGFSDEVIARGREEIATNFAGGAFAAYPDVRMESEAWYEGDDFLVWEWTFSGSYYGQEEGGPAGTGQPVSFGGLSIYELRDGQIARKVFFTDDLTYMQQVGYVLEVPAGTPAP